MKMQYVSVSDYRADEPFEQKCKNCIYFSKVDDMEYPYQCSADTGCKAAYLSKGQFYKGSCKEYKKSEESIGHGKTSFKKILIWAITIPVFWAIAITIVGLIKHTFNTDFTFLEILKNYGFAYIVGVISYIIFKLAQNVINSDLLNFFQKTGMGGKILAFIVSWVLPYITPGIVFAIILLRQ